MGDPCIILKLKWRNCSKWQVHEQLAFISKSNSALESVATKYAFCSIPVYSAITIFSANHERSFLSTSHEVNFWLSGSTFQWILVLHLTPDQFSNDKIWIFQSWKKIRVTNAMCLLKLRTKYSMLTITFRFNLNKDPKGHMASAAILVFWSAQTWNLSMRHGCPRRNCKVRIWDLLRIA